MILLGAAQSHAIRDLANRLDLAEILNLGQKLVEVVEPILGVAVVKAKRRKLILTDDSQGILLPRVEARSRLVHGEFVEADRDARDAGTHREVVRTDRLR